MKFCRLIFAALSVAATSCLSTARADIVTVPDTFGTGQDGFVYAFLPTTPLSNAFSMLPVGKTESGHNTSSLVQFDLSAAGVTAAQVASAKLELFSISPESSGFGLAPDAAHPVAINVYPLNGAWNRNTVAAGNVPATGALNTSFSVNGIGSWFDVDVTSLVAGWLANPGTNFGVYLDAVAPVSNGQPSPQFYFAAFSNETSGSFAPQLVITTVPEPSTAILLLCAVPASVWVARRRRNAQSS